ncbi:excalibur calcium-binding domain-containing protein [Bacillus cereus group sp. TH152-1LC]|uniref:excalibur calcium-binding domain-containing protein n=1 Tax=Bacillus cereus group sp. TH152-1LC TaxID=3018060 RepID=UPI003FA4454D
MKKFICLLTVLFLFFTASSSFEMVYAKTKLIKYKSCKDMNKDYKGGVAKSSSAKNKGSKTKYKPFVSSELYKVNFKLDRDKDNIACER